MGEEIPVHEKLDHANHLKLHSFLNKRPLILAGKSFRKQHIV